MPWVVQAASWWACKARWTSNRAVNLAQNLNELYAYVTRRLFHINAHNDLEALDEVFTLMNDIRQAWNTLPTLMADTAPSVRYAN